MSHDKSRLFGPSIQNILLFLTIENNFYTYFSFGNLFFYTAAMHCPFLAYKPSLPTAAGSCRSLISAITENHLEKQAIKLIHPAIHR